MAATLALCPECQAGKCRNCDGDTWDDEANDFAPCPCAVRDHEPPAPPVSDVDPPEPWVPAFPGQRPPFLPGNKMSVRNRGAVFHGAYSPRWVDPLAQEMVDLVLADPDCSLAQATRHRFALWSWARAEAQVQLLVEFLAKAGETAGDGVGDLEAERVKSAYLLLHRAESRATTGRTRLGLDPLSAARLGRDQAATGSDMAQIMERLHRLQQAGVDVDLGALGGEGL